MTTQSCDYLDRVRDEIAAIILLLRRRSQESNVTDSPARRRGRSRKGVIVFGPTVMSSSFVWSNRPMSQLNVDSLGLYGSAVPDFDLTAETSVALMLPLTITSSRKFAPVTACPDCPLV